MPLSLSRATLPCVVALPTLVIAGRPDLSRHLIDVLAQLAIVDVDVAPDYVAGHMRATERDYSAIILAGRPARRFGFQRFCAGFAGMVGQQPGVIQIADHECEQLPCSLVPAYTLEADFDREDLRRAIWTAVERAGGGCKSAGLCGHLSCTLAPKRRDSH
jgi:hypothetical protein